MTTVTQPLLTSESRLWLQVDGAGPASSPVYQGRARATSGTVNAGSLTPIRSPAPNQYGVFVNAGIIRGAPDLPGVTFEAQRDPEALSEFLSLINKQCAFDAQVHFGRCENPQDFDEGYVTARIFEGVQPATYSHGDLGTFDEGGNAPITDTLEVAAERVYEVKKLRASEVASAEITDEVVDVGICDSIVCGQCGRTSDGCQIAFILVGDTSGSPGLAAELLYTEDAGSTWGTSPITSLAIGESPSKFTCVGTNVVVVSNASGSLHYASINDILDGIATWVEVTTGFDGAGQPNAITSVGPDRTWIAGDAGRIYRTIDPTSEVVEQADGSQTAQNLNAIHAFDRNNVVAVGNSNAILVTANAGDSWSLVVGPAPGVALHSIWMRSTQEWFVGSAGGVLYYTRNGGATWSTKGFASSGSGTVTDIKFASKSVGYFSHTHPTLGGRVFKTINGGFSWNVLPEGTGLTIPENDGLNAVAPCTDNVNVVFAGGLGADGADGIALKFA